MLTCRNVIQRFLKWAERVLSAETVRCYRHHLAGFLAVAGELRVKSLRPIHLTAWCKTWHQAQAVIRAFNWAVKEARLFRVSPFAGVRKPKRGMRRRTLGSAEMLRLLRRSLPAPRAFLLAMRETLARPQEIRLAKWEYLSADDPARDALELLPLGQASIVFAEFKDHARRADPTTSRVLLVSARLGRLLERLRAGRRRPEGFIFVNSQGKPWTRNAIRCMMRRLRRRAGFPADDRGEEVTAYTLRHSQATLAVARGVSDRTLADLLGHVETRTTSRYLHLRRSHLREALQRLQRRNVSK